jgi:CYTH domain-containing protein
MLPKYAKLEIERRWLVRDLAAAMQLAGRVRLIEDRYIDGTHLRLRKVIDDGQTTTFKLGKKYERSDANAQPAVSTYLSEAEFGVLAALPARAASKQRFACAGGSLDVYGAPRSGFAVFEMEFEALAAATSYVPPPFAGEEVTGQSAYNGLAMAD